MFLDEMILADVGTLLITSLLASFIVSLFFYYSLMPEGSSISLGSLMASNLLKETALMMIEGYFLFSIFFYSSSIYFIDTVLGLCTGFYFSSSASEFYTYISTSLSPNCCHC